MGFNSGFKGLIQIGGEWRHRDIRTKNEEHNKNCILCRMTADLIPPVLQMEVLSTVCQSVGSVLLSEWMVVNFSEQCAKLTRVDLLSSYLESRNYPFIPRYRR